MFSPPANRRGAVGLFTYRASFTWASSGLKRRGVLSGPLVLCSGTGTNVLYLTALADTDRQTLRQNSWVAIRAGEQLVQSARTVRGRR